MFFCNQKVACPMQYLCFYCIYKVNELKFEFMKKHINSRINKASTQDEVLKLISE